MLVRVSEGSSYRVSTVFALLPVKLFCQKPRRQFSFYVTKTFFIDSLTLLRGNRTGF